MITYQFFFYLHIAFFYFFLHFSPKLDFACYTILVNSYFSGHFENILQPPSSFQWCFLLFICWAYLLYLWQLFNYLNYYHFRIIRQLYSTFLTWRYSNVGLIRIRNKRWVTTGTMLRRKWVRRQKSMIHVPAMLLISYMTLHIYEISTSPIVTLNNTNLTGLLRGLN